MSGVLAVVVVAVGWLQPTSDITATEAASAARNAFRAAGIEETRVARAPRTGTHHPEGGGEPFPVWRTATRVRGGIVELWLAREDGQPVFLDDRSGDGAVQLLSDEEFQALADHYENPAAGRQIRRNVLLTLAVALVAAVAALWDAQRTSVARGERLRAARRRSSPRPGPVAASPGGPALGGSRPRRLVTPVSASALPPARRASSRSAPLRATSRPDRPLRAQEIL